MNKVFDKYRVGSTHTTNDNKKIKVLNYSEGDRNKRDILFIESNNVKRNVCLSSIYRGVIRDKKEGSVDNKVGLIKVPKTRKELLDGFGNKNILDMYNSSGNKYGIGSIFKTNNCGLIQIINYSKVSKNSRDVLFLNTNYIKKNVPTSSIYRGSIKDNTKDIKPYKLCNMFLTIESGLIAIVRNYRSNKEIKDIMFLNTKHILKKVTIEQIEEGTLKDN